MQSDECEDKPLPRRVWDPMFFIFAGIACAAISAFLLLVPTPVPWLFWVFPPLAILCTIAGVVQTIIVAEAKESVRGQPPTKK